jgi:parallel beta-helix repeat protein
MRRWIFGISLFLVLSVGPANAATLNVPADYPTIREAIKAASAGDTVSVSAGTYAERVRIKRLDGLTLVANGLVLITPGTGRDAIVVKSSNGVTIQGFVVTSAARAVRVVRCENTTVLDNVIEETRAGIRVRGGSANVVKDNDISDLSGYLDEFGSIRGGHGIRVQRSSDVEVRANTVTSALADAAGNGVVVSRASGALVRNNDLSELGRNGIRVRRSPGANVVKNDSSDNRLSGIYINRCSDVVVDENTTEDNGNVGIVVFRSKNLTVTSNVAESNERFGIRVNRSDPLTAVSDLTSAGNSAIDNAVANYRVGKEKE